MFLFIYLVGQIFFGVNAFDAFLSEDVLEFLQQLPLPISDLLDEFDRLVPDLLLDRLYDILTLVDRFDLGVEFRYFLLAGCQKRFDVGFVLDDSLVEVRYLVVLVLVERA